MSSVRPSATRAVLPPPVPPVLPPLGATGVGSLPHADPGAAMRLVQATFPEIPHWPQLPRRSPAEGFVNQYITLLLELGALRAVDGGKIRLSSDDAGYLDAQAALFQIYLDAAAGDAAALGRFGLPRAAAAGFWALLAALGEGTRPQFVKGQLSGPLTVGLQVTSPDLRPAFYDDTAREMIVRALEAHARWQAGELSRLGATPVIFVDEPGMYAYGQSTFVGLQRADIERALDVVFGALLEAGAVPGCHVCARADWSILFASRVAIVDFDAYEYFPSLLVYAGDLAAFLRRGGVIGWGLVPTNERARGETAASLARRFDEYLDVLARHGVDRALLARQALITPSCGTGTLAVDLAEHIYALTAATAAELRRRYAG